MQPVANPAEPQPFSSREFRDTLGSFATGITVITTQGTEHPYGLTANAFTSVSLDPPLVLVCVIARTQGAESIEANRVFAINILGAEQEAISRYFASRDRPRGPDAFKEIAHHQGTTGCPIIDGVSAYLDCRLVASRIAGDHVIFVGEVVAIGNNPEVPPLLFHRGGYRYLRQD